MTEQQPEGQWREQPADGAEPAPTATGDGAQPAALEPYTGQPPAVQPPGPEAGAGQPPYPGQQPYPGQAQSPGQQPYGQPGYGYPGAAGQPPYGSSPYAAVPPSGYGTDPVTGLPWSDKTRTTAGLLQLLLPFAGICGVGRLYAGQIGIGLVQLIGFVVGAFLIIVLVGLVIAPAIWLWSVVDGIVLLSSGGRDGYGRPLR
ncbi:TM2 domain-containing protein [Cellulomonas alba]|uniref:TM2 domain-containing protein n=1 Tax=Cellulomonas alba TaxID=3053467 RepID=A0ABT7SDA6_9CELL|nr:TM2 domain-containing protein [Cellulomonas alba]MDM7854160.1 hypothetical protein [Cellulomonas alba]